EMPIPQSDAPAAIPAEPGGLPETADFTVGWDPVLLAGRLVEITAGPASRVAGGSASNVAGGSASNVAGGSASNVAGGSYASVIPSIWDIAPSLRDRGSAALTSAAGLVWKA